MDKRQKHILSDIFTAMMFFFAGVLTYAICDFLIINIFVGIVFYWMFVLVFFLAMLLGDLKKRRPNK